MNPKGRKGKQVTPPTIGVMFIDQTPGGVLAKKLQEVEDRLSKASGCRIRMVVLSETQLKRLLPDTNPWSGQNCGRMNCYTLIKSENSSKTAKEGISFMGVAVYFATPKRRGRIRRKGIYVGVSR